MAVALLSDKFALLEDKKMKLMKRLLRVATVLGAVGTSLAVGVGDSHAGLGLRIDYGNNGSWETTVQDNGAGDFFSSQLGHLLMGDSFGSVTLTVNTGLSKPAIGSATDPQIDLSTVLYAGGATDIRIQLSDTDFNGLAVGFGQLVSIGGTITSLPGSSVTTNIYRDLANAQFGTNSMICSTGPLLPIIFDAFSGGCGSYIGLDDEYSITMETIIHLTGAGVVSYDAHYRLGREGEIDVPEPASMVLLGFGVMGLGAWRRRRRAQQD